MHLFYTALDCPFHNKQGLRYGWASILKSGLASGHQAPPGRPPPLPRCRRKGNSSYEETCFPLVDGLLCPAPRPPLPCGLASIPLPLQLQQNFSAHLIGLQIITQRQREWWRSRHIGAYGWARVAHANISHQRGPRGGTVNKVKIVTEPVTVPAAADSSICKVLYEQIYSPMSWSRRSTHTLDPEAVRVCFWILILLMCILLTCLGELFLCTTASVPLLLWHR